MNRLECSALRCIAIVSIMLHNFAHWLPGAAPENEFSFSLEHYEYFWECTSGEDFLIHFFSFFGHLGVPIFVFLTGYGLAQKYDHQECIEWKSFLYRHWKKLFIPLVVGTFAYIIVMFVLEGYLACSFSRIVVQCTMLLNLISPNLLLPMPYWYFGLTMQFYLFYLLLVHKRSHIILLLLAIVSLLFMAFLSDYYKVLSWVRYNSIGWLLPLYLGIICSRRNVMIRYTFKTLVSGLLAACLFILLFGFNFYLWLAIPVMVIFAAVFFVKLLPPSLLKWTDYIGKNSLHFFVIHPIVREIIIPEVSCWGGYVGLFLYFALTVLVVYISLIVVSIIKTFIPKTDVNNPNR